MKLNMTGEGKTVEARELLEAVYIIHRHCKSMMENHGNKCCDFCMLGDWKNGCMFSSDEGCAISPEAWDMKQFSKLILRKGKILENEARERDRTPSEAVYGMPVVGTAGVFPVQSIVGILDLPCLPKAGAHHRCMSHGPE